jgi:SAM-dependent methyltransferase
MMQQVDWDGYLQQFHSTHPGITEAALNHAVDPEVGTGFDWLATIVPPDSTTVLDLGCGSAPMRERLDAAVSVGADRSAAELQVALASDRGPVVRADAAALPLRDACIDSVVMSMAYMLVPREQTLAEIHRVLRPGGTFAALVPAMWPIRPADLPGVVALTASLRGPGSMPYVVNPRPLARELRAAGMQPVAYQRRRFDFPLTSRSDVQLAVTALYTPGRSPAQLRRAERVLRALRIRSLPVPLLRFSATKPLR